MVTAENILEEKGGRMVTVPPGATLHDAILVMLNHNVGSVLVEEDGRMLGIWSERDLLRHSIQAGFKPAAARIRDYMVSPVTTVPHSDTIFNLMDKFLGLRIRHLLVEKEGLPIGLLSMGDVMKATLELKNRELKALNAMVSWDYYEDWRWKPRP
jgi:signal-transduction protein with cAMP-binding, CBS, and nucleotidyltransferase domain